MTLLPLLAACRSPVVAGEDSAPPIPPRGAGVSVDGPSEPDLPPACASELLAVRAGGSIDADGATLEIPAEAFYDQVTVSLCRSESPRGYRTLSGAWSVAVDPDIDPHQPLKLAIRTADPSPAAALFVPAPDGTAVRSLSAEPLDRLGGWQGELWRSGTAFVGVDPRHQLPYAPPAARVDLLVLLDDGPSMLDEQAKLGEVLPGVLDRLDVNAVDWHLGVLPAGGGPLSTADGRSWVEPGTPKRDQVLADLLSVGNEASVEQGLASLEAAFSTAQPNGAEPDTIDPFLRGDALLQILVISSHDDASALTPGEVAEDLLGLGRPGVAVHSLVPTSGSNAGTKYLQLTKLVGGQALDLDADWDDWLGPIGDGLLIATGMPLETDDPEPELWIVPPDADQRPCDAVVWDRPGQNAPGTLACLDPIPDGSALWVLTDR